MNWKEQFNSEFLGNTALDLLKPTNASTIRNFISTEIIEKLIEDIPDEWFLNELKEYNADLKVIKQQLRDKWL